MRIILGYGDFKGYSLGEIPESLLHKLSQRFALQSNKHDDSDRNTLLITIAVHEELSRRRAGGERKKRTPTLKELALNVVTKGYHQLSKTHHPDRNGDAETQRRLTEARDILARDCEDIVEEYEDAILIPPEQEFSEISDEDIPF